MLHITAESFAKALGQDYQTASKRLRNLPHQTGPFGTFFLPLARVLPIIRLREDQALPALFATATPIPVPMPEDAESIADTLDEWLREARHRQGHRQAALARYSAAQRAFSQHLADAYDTNVLTTHTERLRRLLILDDSILSYVILNDADAFPQNFRRWSLEFALANTPQKMKKVAA